MNRENENELPPPDDAGPDALDESEVARVFDAYLADVEAGRAVDPDRLIADHPKIAGELRACLEVMSLADRLADGGDSPKLSPLPREHGLRSASDARFTTTLQLSSMLPPASSCVSCPMTASHCSKHGRPRCPGKTARA